MSARAHCWPYDLPKHTLTFLSPLTARSLPANVKAIVQLWATNVCGCDWLCFTIDSNYSNTPGISWVWGPVCQLCSWNVIYCSNVVHNDLHRHKTSTLCCFFGFFKCRHRMSRSCALIMNHGSRLTVFAALWWWHRFSGLLSCTSWLRFCFHALFQWTAAVLRHVWQWPSGHCSVFCE